MPSLSSFARSLNTETAFDVLAIARRLKAHGKDVVELQIGDSPFPTPPNARAAGIDAIQKNQSHYCPSHRLWDFRETISRNYAGEFGVTISAANVVVAAGAKPFEQFFCDAFLDPGDRLVSAVQFVAEAVNRTDRVAKYLESHAKYRAVTSAKAAS